MSYEFHTGDAANLSFLPDGSVDLVFGSPPYDDARTYGIGADRKSNEWVDWMSDVTREALRVTRGFVLWVVSGTGNYSLSPEKLMCIFEDCVYRPCIWTKNAPPTGSGWFSNDWEYILAFCEKKNPYWNPEALKLELKYKSGGSFRQRKKDGTRSEGGEYPTHQFRKRPSNVIHATVGGRHLGSPLAHENEAPFPEALPEYFLPVLCPPGGKVLDPFSGSGTTVAVAHRLGMHGIGVDIRESQTELGTRRLSHVEVVSSL